MRLDLDYCNISDLTPLDTLLLGDNKNNNYNTNNKEWTLEHLALNGNPIKEQDL